MLIVSHMKYVISNLQSYLRTMHRHVQAHPLVLYVGSLLLLIVAIGMLVFQDMYTYVHNNYGVALQEKGDIQSARAHYVKAKSLSGQLSYIPDANIAGLSYAKKEYTQALEVLQGALAGGCLTNTGTTTSVAIAPNVGCADIAYDIGNTFYRLGEDIASTTSVASITATTSATTTQAHTQVQLQKRNTLWQQAIAFYQQTLAIRPTDTEAKENIDFILKKLTASTTKDSNKSNTQNSKKDTAKNDTQKNTNTDASQKEDANVKDTQASKNQDGTSDTQSKNDAEQNATQQSSSKPALSTQDSKQVDAYMQQLDQKSKNMQQYFAQNPQAQKNPQTDSSPFDDPFFQQFLKGTPFEKQFSQSAKPSLEKDW